MATRKGPPRTVVPARPAAKPAAKRGKRKPTPVGFVQRLRENPALLAIGSALLLFGAIAGIDAWIGGRFTASARLPIAATMPKAAPIPAALPPVVLPPPEAAPPVPRPAPPPRGPSSDPGLLTEPFTGAPVSQPPPSSEAPPPPPVAEMPPSPPPIVAEPEPEPEIPPEREVEPPVPPPPPSTEVAPPRPPPPPVIDRSGDVPPWLKNAVPVTLPLNRPAIAVIIDDMGVDRKRTARVAALPGPLTLSWLPYATDLPRQTKAARQAGHELMVHIPMEPGGHDDPGPGALLTGLGRDEILRRFLHALTAFDGYVGVNNHMGSKFTASAAAMEPVLNEMRRRGLLWLDSKTTGVSVGPALAREMKLPNAARDVFLDHDMAPAAVRAALARLEAIARHQGFAIGIGHPHDATIDALRDWLPGLAARGFILVPVSAVVRARQAGG